MVTRVKIIGKANNDGCSPVEATVDGKTSYGIRQKIVSRGTNDTLDEAKKAGDIKAVATLERICRPVDGCYREVFKGMMAQRRIMKKYGGHSMKKAPTGRIPRCLC